MGINVPVIAGGEGGCAGDARLVERAKGSDPWGAALGVSPGGCTDPRSHHGAGEEGGQPRRGVWCLVTFPGLFYPLLCSGAMSCPCRGKEQHGAAWLGHSQRCLLEFLPGRCHVPPLGSLATPARAGRGLSRLDRIQGAGAVGNTGIPGCFQLEHQGSSLSLPFTSTSLRNRGQGEPSQFSLAEPRSNLH